MRLVSPGPERIAVFDSFTKDEGTMLTRFTLAGPDATVTQVMDHGDPTLTITLGMGRDVWSWLQRATNVALGSDAASAMVVDLDTCAVVTINDDLDVMPGELADVFRVEPDSRRDFEVDCEVADELHARCHAYNVNWPPTTPW